LNLVECTSGLEYRCNSPTVHAHVRSKYSRAARIISRAQIFTVLVASSIFRSLPSPSMTCLPTANFTRGRKSYIDNYRLFSPAATNPVLAKSAVHSRARACALSAFRVARRKIAAPRLINRSTSRIGTRGNFNVYIASRELANGKWIGCCSDCCRRAANFPARRICVSEGN